MSERKQRCWPVKLVKRVANVVLARDPKDETAMGIDEVLLVVLLPNWP